LGQPLSSSVQQYARDAYGRASAVSLDGQSLATFEYDDNGQLDVANFASEDSVRFSYDPLTRRFVAMSEASARWSASNSQRMNARGWVDYETIRVNELNRTRVYGYSPPGFLISSVDAQTSYTYEFDPFGRPTVIQQDAERRPLVSMDDTLTAGGVVYRFD